MSFLIDKAAFAAEIHKKTNLYLSMSGEDVCGMSLIHLFAGIIAETVFLFDEPESAYDEIIRGLSRDLGVPCGYDSEILKDLPTASAVDRLTEAGRSLARDLFEEWLHCAYDFYDILNFTLHHLLVHMEDAGIDRGYGFSLLQACADKCLTFEIAAQELCDLVIERKVGEEGWSVAESVSGLSAVAGRFLGLCRVFDEEKGPGRLSEALLRDFDDVAYVMTQEAIRLGIPAGSDWRQGLAANDYPATAPFELIFSLLPDCKVFFKEMGLHDELERAVACAKAAGRMLAVAAGGEQPEVEPIVAKPLAMAAFTDTFRAMNTMEESGVIA